MSQSQSAHVGYAVTTTMHGVNAKCVCMLHMGAHKSFESSLYCQNMLAWKPPHKPSGD